MHNFVNPDMLNLLASEKITTMQQQAEVANRAKLCWAIRFINFHLPRPDFPGKPASVKRQAHLAQS